MSTRRLHSSPFYDLMENVLKGEVYAISHYGLEIGNQLKDYEDDRLRGIITLPSQVHTISCSVGLSLLGLGLVFQLIMLTRIFQLGLWSTIIAGGIFGLAYAQPIKTYLTSLKNPDRILNLFRDLNYARWQTNGMIGYLIIAVVIRILNMTPWFYTVK